MADLASFLLSHPGCDSPFCTTCGGTVWFYQALDKYLADSQPLESQLLSLPHQVTYASRRLGCRLPLLLDRVGPVVASRVVDNWVRTARDHGGFAACLMTWPPRSFPASLARVVVESVAPRAVHDRQLHTELRDRFPELVGSSPSLQEAYRQYEEADRRAAEEVRARKREEARSRQVLLDELAAMEPAARFRRLLSTTRLQQRDLPSNLASASLEQLEELTHSETESLIRYVGWSPTGDWENLLKMLFRVRHAKRGEEMDKVRARLDGLSLSEQLLSLLSDGSVPIELYPVELAHGVDSEILLALPVALQDRLRELLAGTRLRRWKEAHARLFPLQPGIG